MNHFKRISVVEADKILASNTDTTLLDIRDEYSYRLGHHPKAAHLSDSLLRKIIKTTDRQTPIIIYCYHGNSSQDIAAMLIEFGFKFCYSVDGGYPAWMYQSSNSFPISERLGDWMKERNYKEGEIDERIDSQNLTPIMVAAKMGREDIVRDLVEAGANPNLTDYSGNNALWYACMGQNIDCVKILINADVEVDNQNHFGFTALSYAVGIDDIFDLLSKYVSCNSLINLINVKQKQIDRQSLPAFAD